MIIVVSDASPIINLAAVSRLPLLQELFGSILVPPSVWTEVMAGEQFALPDWVELRSPANQPLVSSLCAELDRGEAEAIALAAEIAAGLVLIDEKKGRAVARRLGLCPLGLLGVLTESKARGLIPEVKPLLNLMVRKAGFRITEALYRQVLQSVGEA